MSTDNKGAARVKPMKIFPSTPLKAYLELVGTTNDFIALSRSSQLHKLDDKISNSTHINRLAERHLWIRRQNFPLLSLEAWTAILNAHNPRSEFEFYELGMGMVSAVIDNSGLDYDIVQALFDNNYDTDGLDPILRPNYLAAVELTKITPTEVLVIQEFIESFWGDCERKAPEQTFREKLAHFAGLSSEVVFSDDDPLDAWSFETKFVTNNLGNTTFDIIATNSNGMKMQFRTMMQDDGGVGARVDTLQMPNANINWLNPSTQAKKELHQHIFKLAEKALLK